MTAAETIPQTAVAPAARPLPAWRRAIVFGTGFGVTIGERDLHTAIVRARPSGAMLLSEITIADFRARPAAEWGSELSKFLAAAGESSLPATVLLPRSEVIVRTLSLPGVSDKDAASAIELQIETLHPYGDEEIAWSWSRTGAASVMVALVRKTVLDPWETLFSEAGIPLAAISFSPAVAYAALRIWNVPPSSVLCFATTESGRTEIYGESEARPVYSAELSMSLERALSLARAELRLPPDYPASPLADVLPAPGLVGSAALAGAVPRASLGHARIANLLPPERRATHNRVQFFIPAFLAILLLAALAAVFLVLPAIEQRRYREDLDRAARKLEPAAARVRNLERSISSNRARIAALDDFRARPQADLDVLNELTRLLPADAWTNSIEIYPDSAIIAGEATEAAPLLKLLDSSPLFQNSEFVSSVTRNAQAEQFRIKTMRRGRIGKATP